MKAQGLSAELNVCAPFLSPCFGGNILSTVVYHCDDPYPVFQWAVGNRVGIGLCVGLNVQSKTELALLGCAVVLDSST